MFKARKLEVLFGPNLQRGSVKPIDFIAIKPFDRYMVNVSSE